MLGGCLKRWRLVLTATFLAISPGIVLAEEGGLGVPEHTSGAVSIPLENLGSLAPSDGLRVFVGPASACCEGRSPVTGRYRVAGDLAYFAPAFPFIEGQVYSALIMGTTIKEFVVGLDSLPEQPEVVAIYPSGPVIPENTLRFYIEFARPMQPHRAEEFIALQRADGTEDRAAFMSFKQELWNRDRTRLTLLMDPGRIKRGVATNLELGPALESGQSYALVVGDGWPGANGATLDKGFRAAFVVGDPLRTRPDPERWVASAPRLRTLDPLDIRFDRPFDHVQLRHAIVVQDTRGRPIGGSVSVLQNGSVWRFVPDDVWIDPEILVAVDATLEDVAGNNFREVLDHAVGTPAREVDEVTFKVTLTSP